jgi:hypothetical protein
MRPTVRRAKHHFACAQRFRRKHNALDRASFFQFFFSQFLNGVQLQRQRGRGHSPVQKRVVYTGERFGVSANLTKHLPFSAKMAGVVSLRNSPRVRLEVRVRPRHNFTMKSLVGLLVGAALLFVVYHFYMKGMPTTDSGTAPTQAISLTGVRTDLLQIADAEHGYIATNGHCASLDELISSNSISMTRTGRDGYTYAIECSAVSSPLPRGTCPHPLARPSGILTSPSTPACKSGKSNSPQQARIVATGDSLFPQSSNVGNFFTGIRVPILESRSPNKCACFLQAPKKERRSTSWAEN